MILNADQLQAARDWLADNVWLDMGPDDFDTMPDAKTEAGIASHYAGGLDAFVLAEAAPPPAPGVVAAAEIISRYGRKEA